MENLDSILIALVIFIGLFLILREFFTWYFKQSKIVEQNEKIINLLTKSIELKKIEMGIIKTAESEDDRDFMNS